MAKDVSIAGNNKICYPNKIINTGGKKNRKIKDEKKKKKEMITQQCYSGICKLMILTQGAELIFSFN